MQENQHAHMEDDATSRAYTVAPVALKRGSVQPPQRGGATLTQVASGEVYLIGGANREALCFGDVYKLDLRTQEWTLIATRDAAFPARSGHSAVAVGQRIFVFGGLNSVACEVYNDVHVFDTQTRRWSQIDIADGEVPMPRNAHAAILLPTEAASSYHRMLIYGGSSPDDGAFDDAFVLQIPLATDSEADGSDGVLKNQLRWEKLESCAGEKPEARELHVATLLPGSSSPLICFSGGRNFDGNICTDMALLDCSTWEWQLVPICEWNRCSHAAGLVDGALVSFGGFDGGAIRNDCWVYHDDAESWLRANTDSAAVSDGRAQAQSDKRDQHGTDGPEISPAASVLERFGHAGCTVTLSSSTAPAKASATKQALLVFGGMNAASDLNDLVLIEQR